jgi:hypothetical protein
MTQYFNEIIEKDTIFIDILTELVNNTDDDLILFTQDTFLTFDNLYTPPIKEKDDEILEAIKYLNQQYNDLIKSDFNHILLLDFLKRYLDIATEYPTIPKLTWNLLRNGNIKQ